MDKMKKLYEKVAENSALQEKFAEIMKNAEKAGAEETEKKLTAFAKEAGYDVTVEEMQTFFKNLAEKTEGQLSDEELDAVAGGKSPGGIFTIVTSVATVGITCALGSAFMAAGWTGHCENYFR